MKHQIFCCYVVTESKSLHKCAFYVLGKVLCHHRYISYWLQKKKFGLSNYGFSSYQTSSNSSIINNSFIAESGRVVGRFFESSSRDICLCVSLCVNVYVYVGNIGIKLPQ